MIGIRLSDGLPDPWPPSNGSYWKMQRLSSDDTLTWHGMTPNGLFCCLANHSAVEHEDGTVTISPSILCRQTDFSWHGFLERGVWREV